MLFIFIYVLVFVDLKNLTFWDGINLNEAVVDQKFKIQRGQIFFFNKIDIKKSYYRFTVKDGEIQKDVANVRCVNLFPLLSSISFFSTSTCPNIPVRWYVIYVTIWGSILNKIHTNAHLYSSKYPILFSVSLLVNYWHF